MLSSDKLDSSLRQFTGTDNWYHHPFSKALFYTDGARYFFQNGGHGGAYWLLDEILFHLKPKIDKDRDMAGFCQIKVKVKESKKLKRAWITLDDGNGNVKYRANPVSTDLQEGEWRFYVRDDVLMLPTEY